LKTACERLDLPTLPELYIATGAELNAFTVGVERPLVGLTTGAVELLSPQESLFVIAHEVGHIRSNHVLYYQIAEYLSLIGEIVASATLGISEVVGTGFKIALLYWQRMSEFTADRAGLLACQDADVALRSLMKLAGLPPRYYQAVNTEDFVRQAREFETMDVDKLTILAKWLSTMGATHPWTVMRAKELLRWVDSGEYERVLQGAAAGRASVSGQAQRTQ